MRQLTKPDAIEYMNQLAMEKRPFLFIIDFRMKAPVILPESEIDNQKVLFDIQGIRNYATCLSPEAKRSAFAKYPIAYDIYKQAFTNINTHIYNGNSYLVNLTFPTRIETNLSLKEIFFLSTAKYKLMIEDQFVVFSPECFVQIHDNIISTYPMKGTIDASIVNAEEIILNDIKESAEHVTVVDLLRNDLSMVADHVHVESFRYVERINTNQKDLLQVSSKITGQLQNDYQKRLGDIIFTLLPAGSISGAPKKNTVEIILENEMDDRGYYTGIFGYFDGKSLDSGVMIRFIENRNGTFYYRSGGGITADSNPTLEYQELIDKIYVPVG